jgi:hypothetical protein
MATYRAQRAVRRIGRLKKRATVAGVLAVIVAVGMVDAAPVLASTGTQAAHDQYGYPYPNAPDCDEGPTLNGCLLDAWSFYQGQCTS